MSSSSITRQLLPMDANQTFGSVTTNSSFTTTSMTFENLTAGYYILKVFASVPGSFTYQSDPFSCPSFYDLNFPDQMQIYEACSPKPTATIISETSEDHTTRNIILIAVFSAVAGVGLIALIIFFAKKGTAVSITGVSSNDSSQVNIEDAGSSQEKGEVCSTRDHPSRKVRSFEKLLRPHDLSAHRPLFLLYKTCSLKTFPYGLRKSSPFCNLSILI